MAISEETQTQTGLFDQLSPSDRVQLIGLIRGEIASILERDARLQRKANDLVRSEVVAETLENLVTLTGDDPEDLLLRALTLYEVAYKGVTQQNQRLVLVSHDYEFVREIVGFGETRPESEAAETKAG